MKIDPIVIDEIVAH